MADEAKKRKSLSFIVEWYGEAETHAGPQNHLLRPTNYKRIEYYPHKTQNREGGI